MLPVCMMVVLLCLQSNALNIAQTYHLQVGYGDMVILPCNASTYLEKEEGALLWEAMGEDVAILQGEELRQADRFKGRFALPSEEHLREGEWSLELGYALLSDTDLYECIWQGRKTISTVWLQVSVPHVERSMLELAGDTVTLPCYIQMSRKQSPDDMFVWWTWNGNTIALFHADESSFDDLKMVDNDSHEAFHLRISPALMTDSGEYQCLYKTSITDDYTRLGTPESITLTVVETNTTDIEDTWLVSTNETTGATEDWVSTSQWPGVSTTETDVIPVFLEDPTQPIEVLTELQQMEAFEETQSSRPYEAAPETSQPDTVPWVRYGLIAGVLLVTAVVLCILKAAQRI
ncbi:hypothetical protein PBY51_016819 [Eleginops maclovinus]|uniref:Ig-like domain-containing protein n=1 Tax=Eleginops maclovinus TaxID=56733 RepID=A0AAN7W8V2_ELEMC|nr:hypothetical protein PBY51_016819 [Eleginops maclovinus]